MQYFLLFYLNSLFMSMCVFVYREKKKLGGKKATQTMRELYKVWGSHLQCRKVSQPAGQRYRKP